MSDSDRSCMAVDPTSRHSILTQHHARCPDGVSRRLLKRDDLTGSSSINLRHPDRGARSHGVSRVAGGAPDLGLALGRTRSQKGRGRGRGVGKRRRGRGARARGGARGRHREVGEDSAETREKRGPRAQGCRAGAAAGGRRVGGGWVPPWSIRISNLTRPVSFPMPCHPRKAWCCQSVDEDRHRPVTVVGHLRSLPCRQNGRHRLAVRLVRPDDVLPVLLAKVGKCGTCDTAPIVTSRENVSSTFRSATPQKFWWKVSGKLSGRSLADVRRRDPLIRWLRSGSRLIVRVVGGAGYAKARSAHSRTARSRPPTTPDDSGDKFW